MASWNWRFCQALIAWLLLFLAVDGGWSDWSDWSQCSYDCGWKGGEQTATRTCTNPPPSNGGRDCTGDSEKKQVCNKFKCGKSIDFS